MIETENVFCLARFPEFLILITHFIEILLRITYSNEYYDYFSCNDYTEITMLNLLNILSI